MAKNVKPVDGKTDGHGVSALRGNGYDPEAVKAFVSRIENLNGDLATEKSEFMTRCKVIHGDLKVVYDEAKDTGIPKKELKKAVKRRALLASVEKLRDDLEGEQQDNYDKILLALGDLGPLGEAAIKAAA
jgi:uncharacterized protein (UPF0335 family)